MQIPRSTIHDVLHKCLRLCAYTMQLMQQIKLADHQKCMNFATHVLGQTEEHNIYINHILFTDKDTFHISGAVDDHYCRIWGSENLHHVIEHICDSTKVDVWHGLCDSH